MFNTEQYQRTVLEERIYRLYGARLAEEIIKAADIIQIKSKRKMTFETAVKKAIDWVHYKYTREEISQLQR